MEPLFFTLMRAALLVLLLASSLDASAQDSLRRVSSTPITLHGIASPIDSLPISNSIRRVEPTQAFSSNSLEHVVRAVPGVQIDNRNNYALGDRITMRGIGARSFFGTRGIRVIKDDIPLTFADGQTNLEIVDPSQIASVTVLHGPASTIFGNASGGTLLLKSSMPPSPGTLVRGSASFGSYGYQRYTGSLGGASGPVSYGAYITLDSMIGYRDWNGMNAVHFGTQALYTIDEDALRLTFDNVSFSAQNPGALSQKLLDSNRRMAYSNNLRARTGKDGHQTQLGLTWLDASEKNSMTASIYAIARSITNPTPQQIVELDRTLFGLRMTYDNSLSTSSKTTHLTEPNWYDRLDWSGVLDVQYQLDDRLERANTPGQSVPGELQTDQDESIFNVGAGFNAKLPLLNTLALSGGVRFDGAFFSATDHFLSNGNQSGSVPMLALSPSLGLLYTGFENIHYFVNASLNFESPTSTELANQPDGSGGYNKELSPQRIIAGEAGWRWQIMDGLQFNAALFTASIRDALIPFQVQDQEGRDFYRNAGTIANNGFEIELLSEPIDGLRAALGYTYVDSRFKEYVVDSVAYDGNAQPGVHPHLGSLDVIYRMPLGLYLNSTVRFAGKVAVNDANTVYSSEYTVVDLKLGFNGTLAELGKYELGLEPYIHVLNLFNRRYVGSFAINAFGGRYFEPSPERSVVMGIMVQL